MRFRSLNEGQKPDGSRKRVTALAHLPPALGRKVIGAIQLPSHLISVLLTSIEERLLGSVRPHGPRLGEYLSEFDAVFRKVDGASVDSAARASTSSDSRGPSATETRIRNVAVSRIGFRYANRLGRPSSYPKRPFPRRQPVR